LKIFVSLIIMASVSVSAYACGGCAAHASNAMAETVSTPKHDHDHASHQVRLDNIVKADSKGNHTALCGCGMDVTVGEHTINTIENGVQLYFCGSNCQNMVAKMSDKDRTALQSKFIKSN